VEGDNVFLVHYLDKEYAEAVFEAERSLWEEFVRKYKKTKLENIFKQKGWKVR
jgi:hypothetical protein